jgi:hypothetical protein
MVNRYAVQDPILTNLALGYSNEAYVAERLLPTLPVGTQSGKHFIYDRARFRPSPTGGVRAQGANSEEVKLSLTAGLPYFCDDHAKKIFVTDEDVDNNVQTLTDPFQDATEHVTDIQLIDREVEAASVLTDTSIMTQNVTLSGSDQFNDSANSDPVSVVQTAKTAIHAATFQMPNRLLIGKQVIDALMNHPDFIERVKYSQLGVLTSDLLARIFDVEEVIVASAGKNTSAYGQTDTMGYIWGKNMILAYVDPRPRAKFLTLGLTYQWKSAIVERLRGTDEQDRRGTYVRRGDHYYDQKLVSASAGYLIKNAVA